MWGTRSVRDLYNPLRASMPSDRPGALSEAQFRYIVAYILQFNGRTPGQQPLTPATDASIAIRLRFITFLPVNVRRRQ